MEDVIAKEERPYKGIVYYDRTLKKYVVLWDEEESEFEHLDELKKLIGSDEVVYVCES